MKNGRLLLGPPAPASGCASARIRVTTPSSSESQTSQPPFCTLLGLSGSSSTLSIGTVLLTHSRALLRISSSSIGCSSSHSSLFVLLPVPALHLRNCEGDEAEEPPAMLRIIVAPAKASTLGVAASSGRTVGLKFVELLSLGGLGMMPSRDPLGDLRFHESRRPEVEPAPPPKEPLVERPEQPCCCCSQRKFASASRGPRLASKASSGDGSPSLLWQKGCSNKACAAGRSLGSKLRQAERKERKPSLENVFATSGSLKPVGGFVMMTNMARDGGI
mmetsp:Transcript_145986/g.468108  ORF Transcript_145986/g.468108 Transcript_145986/m.468108 type:complete len:275 (+) Transcript_145986:342-1166(+)